MNETHVVFKKVFEPIAKVFCAVMVIMCMAGLFLSGYWMAESKNKGFIVINDRLDAIQGQINTGIARIENEIAKIDAQIIKFKPTETLDNLLTESDVIDLLEVTHDELKKWRKKGLKHYHILKKIFYFEKDIVDFIRQSQRK